MSEILASYLYVGARFRILCNPICPVAFRDQGGEKDWSNSEREGEIEMRGPNQVVVTRHSAAIAARKERGKEL